MKKQIVLISISALQLSFAIQAMEEKKLPIHTALSTKHIQTHAHTKETLLDRLTMLDQKTANLISNQAAPITAINEVLSCAFTLRSDAFKAGEQGIAGKAIYQETIIRSHFKLPRIEQLRHRR